MAYKNIYVDMQRDESPTVYVWDDQKGLIILPWADFNYAYVKDPKGRYLSMTGERLSRTKRFTRGHPSVFESDLPKETRVLTDLYLNEDTPSEGNVVMFFDIEVSMANGIPDIDKPNNEVTSIAMYDPTLNKYTVIVLDKEQTYEDRETETVDTIFCPTEVDLLHKFVAVYETVGPTIITGWNSNHFDVPYLYNRIRQVCGTGVASRLSPIGKVRYSERQNRYRIAGVSSLDYLDLYKKFTYTQRPNYRLDTIGRIEVDMGKIPYDGSLDQLFRDDLDKFIEYNLQDVRIIVEMDKKLKLIDLVRGICHIGHVPYEDYPMSSRFLEGTIVTYLHRKGIIVTDKPQDSREKMEALDRGEEGFVGAYVKEPVPGLYDWVYSLDLQSLYPSIIMSLNISPEAKVGFVRNYDVEQHIRKEITAYVVEEKGVDTSMEMDYDTFMSFLTDNNLTVSSNGVLYTNDKKGIIPEILETWFAQRVEFKNLMKKYVNEGDTVKAAYYDQRQHIQKIFLNSLYGVLGLPVFRFYDVDNAAAVTITGQDVIKSSAKVVNKQYEKLLGEGDYVTYIDTDSIYASAKPILPADVDPKQFTIDKAREMESLLNKFYDTFAKRAFNCHSHRLFIKGESVASTGFWVSKKRYALDKVYDLETNQDVSKMVVKGLDVVRSSFPKAFGDFMRQMLKDILKGMKKEETDNKILEFKASLDDRSYLDIARNTTANNISEYVMDNVAGLKAAKKSTPAHIKSAIIYNRLLVYFGIDDRYEPISDGEKIKYVYLKKNPLQIEAVAVKGYQDPPQITDFIKQHIDTDALFNNELKNKLDDFYSALKWGNIPTEVNQNANEFFSF
jgi:DNA polymerase elongation subunit (family B)